ncbi:hypothetical protein BHE90_010087 [Fusarium euwallaceae]|uniref:Uncharacterized protein n=1 Tax=Fusarium euwallaceae TaxID=1147111 RepID=A0A430LID8_9HYPO|nr:hypothetical protein BHE90_010087 [Fusarium euwallaceae]
MSARVYGLETISFTIQAGTRVGAGLIEFSSRQISYTTGDTEVTVTATPEHGRTACKSAACLGTASITSSVENTQSTSTPLSSLSSRSSPHPDFRSFANECLPWCYPYSITNWP